MRNSGRSALAVGFFIAVASMVLAALFPASVGLAGFSSGGGPVSSANMPDPYTPVDGTMNVTGAITASTDLTGGGVAISSSKITRSGNAGMYLDFNATARTDLSGNVADGATAVAVRIQAYPDYTTSGAKILSVGDNAGTSYAEKFYVDYTGALASVGASFDLTGPGAFVRLNSQGIIEDSGNDLKFTSAEDLLITVAAASNIISNGAVGSGGTINGVEIDYSTADTLATDTTPVSVTGISLAIDANDTYAVICQGTVFTALATAGPQMGLDLPASATQVATCHTGTTASAAQYLSFTADDGFCANLNGLTSPGTPFTLYSKVTNSTNAGNIVLRIRSETTDDVTVVAGAKCEAKKIVDS